jgi:hypothetical protein
LLSTLRPSRRPLSSGKRREIVLARAQEGETAPLRALECILGALEWISLGHQLSDGPRKRAVMADTIEDNILWRFRAASIIDWYIVGWVILESGAYLRGLDHIPYLVLAGVAVYRLVEIGQVFANAVLFERKRSARAGVVVYMVMSIPRSIVQSIVLLSETILCFGALFFVGRSHLSDVANGQDALDFSIRTITTIGPAGEAEGVFRLLVDAEPLVGLLFAGAVLARLINAMPRFPDIREALAKLEAAKREQRAQ